VPGDYAVPDPVDEVAVEADEGCSGAKAA
jgi:hypothetical protein